jgi:hypothetical protein
MVEEVLVTGALTQEMIVAGTNLLRNLDKAKFAIRGALWLYLPEENCWRLFFALPEVRVLGPKAVYKKIRSLINKLPENEPKIETKDITVTDENAPLIVLIRGAISTGPDICGVRFSRNTINGHYIEDAYIYRLT